MTGIVLPFLSATIKLLIAPRTSPKDFGQTTTKNLIMATLERETSGGLSAIGWSHPGSQPSSHSRHTSTTLNAVAEPRAFCPSWVAGNTDLPFKI